MKKTLILTAASAAVLCATAATAQTAQPAAPAAAAARPSNPGPVIAGVCVLDDERAIAQSSAGRAYSARMQTLTQQVQAELRPIQTQLQTDLNTYQTQRATLPQDQQRTRDQALQTRAENLERTAGTRQRELQATQERQINRIITEMQPIVSQIYVQRGCGIMLDRGAVVFSNPAMEVTDAVIQQLNARLPTLTFERERMPAAAAPAAAAPAAPATRR